MKERLPNALPVIKKHLKRINPKKWFQKLKDPRDENKKFDENKLDEISELIENEIDMTVILSLYGFFLSVEKSLLLNMLHQYTQTIQMETQMLIKKL